MAQAPYPGRSPAACLIMYSHGPLTADSKQKKVRWLFLLLGFFFFFRVVGGGYEKQVFSGWCPGQSQPTRLRDPGRSYLPLPTRAPPRCGARVPTPTSTLLAIPWACYPRGQPSWHLGVPGRPRRAKGEDVGGAGRGRGGAGGGPSFPRAQHFLGIPLLSGQSWGRKVGPG